ncbi:class III lanthipeptide [Deinococcus misasensis]|uniref:class III lanthipeptide n=1 Tax=Deinococcus misasensis TaxID=392413 RepID=UPI000AF2FBD4|nr:class III lanthipeptide [Deinococcus misasensis]
MKNILNLQSMKADNSTEAMAWSTASEGCNTIGTDEWSTWSEGCTKTITKQR